MIETIEQIKNLINHFFHKEGDFAEIRKCKCWEEYLARDLKGLAVTEWEIVLWLVCSKCKEDDFIQLNIVLDEVSVEDKLKKSSTVEDLLK
jgi:hypothetical protein